MKHHLVLLLFGRVAVISNFLADVTWSSWTEQPRNRAGHKLCLTNTTLYEMDAILKIKLEFGRENQYVK